MSFKEEKCIHIKNIVKKNKSLIVEPAYIYY